MKYICYDMLGYIALTTTNITDVLEYAKKQFPLSKQKISKLHRDLHNHEKYIDVYYYEHGFNIEKRLE